MRGRLATAVRSCFDSRLRAELPQFALIKVKNILKGNRAYRWVIGPDLAVFLQLEIGPGQAFSAAYDWFTVEAGWSESGRYPEAPPGGPHDASTQGELRFRITQLWWNNRGLEPVWWLVDEPPPDQYYQWLLEPPPVEEALARVAPQVEDAVRRIVHDAIPYFHEIATTHGHV